MQPPANKSNIYEPEDSLVIKLFRSGKNVLTTSSIAMLWGETNPTKLKNKIAYYVRTKVLHRLSRGVFVKNINYNPKELAASIYTPAYISFETVLREEGVIFQYYDSVFVASPYSKEVIIDGKKIVFRKVKKQILYNNTGVVTRDGFSIATKERAFLDMIYLYPGYYFDNLKFINWDKCFELVKIYKNKEMFKRLEKYKNNYAE